MFCIPTLVINEAHRYWSNSPEFSKGGILQIVKVSLSLLLFPVPRDVELVGEDMVRKGPLSSSHQNMPGESKELCLWFEIFKNLVFQTLSCQHQRGTCLCLRGKMCHRPLYFMQLHSPILHIYHFAELREGMLRCCGSSVCLWFLLYRVRSQREGKEGVGLLEPQPDSDLPEVFKHLQVLNPKSVHSLNQSSAPSMGHMPIQSFDINQFYIID